MMLNAAEAVYGFAAWLTTLEEETKMGSLHNCAEIASLVAEFCEVNGLPEVSEQWPSELIHPPSKKSA